MFTEHKDPSFFSVLDAIRKRNWSDPFFLTLSFRNYSFGTFCTSVKMESSVFLQCMRDRCADLDQPLLEREKWTMRKSFTWRHLPNEGQHIYIPVYIYIYIYMRPKVELGSQKVQITPGFGDFSYILMISRVLGRFRSYKLGFECIITSSQSSELLVNTCWPLGQHP